MIRSYLIFSAYRLYIRNSLLWILFFCSPQRVRLLFFLSYSLLLHCLLKTPHSNQQQSIMSEEYDYESLGSNSSMAQNALAGAFAGAAEHCAMYPVDSIKVKKRYMQHRDALVAQ